MIKHDSFAKVVKSSRENGSFAHAILFTFNAVTFLAGCVLFAAGAAAIRTPPQQFNVEVLQNEVSLAAIVLFLAGGLLNFMSILGLVGLLTRNKTIMLLYNIAIGSAFTGHFTVYIGLLGNSYLAYLGDLRRSWDPSLTALNIANCIVMVLECLIVLLVSHMTNFY
jgi:hypothetical protein